LHPIPENGFTNREELQAWLDALPEDVSRPIAASLAIRAANRAVPFLHLIMSRDERFSNGQILLGELRPNFVSRVGQKWPKAQIIQATLASSQFVSNSLAKVLAKLEEEKTNSKSQSEKLTISQSQLVLHQFGVAAHLAASVVSDVRMNTFVSLTSIQFSCALLTLDAWNEVTYDVNKIAAGLSPISLLDEPLVVSPPPTIWTATRAAFNAHLASPGPDWVWWSDWYDSVVEGQPAFNLPPALAKDLSLRIALGGNTETFNQDFWNRTPEAANAEISGWLKEARAKASEADLPLQDPKAIMFAVNAEGKIDRVPPPPEHRLLETPQQRREYEDIRQDAFAMAHMGENRLGIAAPQISDLLLAMPEDFTLAEIYSLWRALNRLRRTHNTHLKVADSLDPDNTKLDPSVAEELAGLLASLNNFAVADPGLHERDLRAIPPQDRADLNVERAIANEIFSKPEPIVKISTPEAIAVLDAEHQNAEGAGDSPHDLQAIDQANRTDQNWILATLASARRYATPQRVGAALAKGALISAGGIAFTAAVAAIPGAIELLQFIAIKAGPLIDYADIVLKNVSLKQLIEWIKINFGSGS
jgi:hypothetical protein